MEIILVEVNVKPERLNDFLDLIKYDAEHSEGDEPGCLRFDVLRDTEDPHKFFYYEVYKDASARAAHRETPHFKKYAAESADMFTGSLNRHILTNQVPSDANWR
ncbi:MAG TPA: antibiotic biosynthesis monooxygenase [Candidatus Paceibacterota bacterium]|nr:antibiotic biosynthesis monooxygenase [Candidatus Paceibacterota bacterium]